MQQKIKVTSLYRIIIIIVVVAITVVVAASIWHKYSSIFGEFHTVLTVIG